MEGNMKAKRIVQVGLSFLVLCLFALHCGDPNLPTIRIVSPADNTVFVGEAVPYTLPVPVEVTVPAPGCGGTGPAIDPNTFTALLARLEDGDVVSEVDVASYFVGAQDPETKVWTWTAASLELSSFGDYQLNFTIQNASGQGANTLTFRLEQAVAQFPGGTFIMGVSSLTQTPSNCLLNDFLIGAIYGLISGMTFPLSLPSGAAIIASGNSYFMYIPLPAPLGNIPVYLSLDEPNNDYLIDGPDVYTINLTGLVPLPGFDCVITASADGVFNDMDTNDPDGSLTIAISDVQTSPGGTCTLVAPTGDCSLIVGMDGDPI